MMDDDTAKSANYAIAIMRAWVQNPAPAGQSEHSANVCDSSSKGFEVLFRSP